MTTPWQETLRQVLGGYFGDQSVATGAREMVFVTRLRPDYHHLYLSALDKGIAAAADGEPEILTIIRNSLSPRIGTIAQAQDLLERIRAEYLAQYNAAVSKGDD